MKELKEELKRLLGNMFISLVIGSIICIIALGSIFFVHSIIKYTIPEYITAFGASFIIFILTFIAFKNRKTCR